MSAHPVRTGRDRPFLPAGEDDPEGLYEHAPCGYLSTAADGTIVKLNQTLLDWTGYRRDELLGRRFVDLLSPGARIYHETHYAPMLRMQGMAREIALDIVRADGGRFPALITSVLVRDERGTPTVIRTAVFDATERRAYERELLAAKRRAEESEARTRILAETLQRAMMPPPPPRIAGLEVAARFRPAGTGEEIGGDFYDVFENGHGDWFFTLGDVEGKGVDAAVVAALVRNAIRVAALDRRRPSEVLQTVNEVVRRDAGPGFVTAVVIRLRYAHTGWIATVSSAGHPLPLLIRRDEQPVDWGRHGTLLGPFEAAVLHDVDTELHPGDALVLYTDGVPESRSDRTWFGASGVLAAAARAEPSATAIVDAILDDVLAFEDTPRDDIAIVAVRVGTEPPA